MKKLILGLGVSGKGAAALLESRGIEYVAVDRKGPIFDRPDFPLDDISEIILSPGIERTHPIVQRAGDRQVIGEVELAFRYLNNRCIGVTGSNGKTTTCSLIEHILRAAGVKAKAVGNIGDSISAYAVKPDPEEILILELSSFQLETLNVKKLELSVVLNISANHLDRHASMEEYVEAKARICHCSEKTLISQQVAKDWGAFFPGAEVFDLDPFCPEEYTILGKQNVLASEKVCAHFGIKEFRNAILSFEKPPHRVEFVCEKSGVLYYNDSKATSVEAVIHAVSLMKRPVVLIAGGFHKGSSYKPWIEKFQGKVKKIVIYGEASKFLEADLKDAFPLEKRAVFADAVKCAQEMAEVGDCVLLSPGCSSYDQFENYIERGDAFKKGLELL